jgi:uncharacterized protein (TIGR02001 family)
LWPALRVRLLFGGFAAGLLLAGGWSSASGGEWAASVAVQNDFQFRGYALGLNRPVAIANFAYDHASGYYGAASAIGVLEREDGPELLGAIVNVGYARRLSSGVTLEGGLIGVQYFDLYGAEQSAAYGEAYLGVLARGLSTRIYYSPRYFDTGSATVYAEVEAAAALAPKLRLRAHVGALSFLGGRGDAVQTSTQLDWAVGASRQLGPLELHATINGGGPAAEYYQGRPHEKAAIVAGVIWSF